MKKLLFVISILVFNNCCDYGFKLSEFKHEKLNFLDLPIEVKEFLRQAPNFENENPSSLFFINPEESSRYVLEIVNTWIGPWTDYMKLIDMKNDVSYRIDQGVPSPFFVFENKLYIPDKFNIIVVSNYKKDVEFTCYYLK